MNLNTHPHPYGIVIAGNDLGTAGQSYLYCAAYGHGSFIVRGFGPEPFQMNGLWESQCRRAQPGRSWAAGDGGNRHRRLGYKWIVPSMAPGRCQL